MRCREWFSRDPLFECQQTRKSTLRINVLHKVRKNQEMCEIIPAQVHRLEFRNTSQTLVKYGYTPNPVPRIAQHIALRLIKLVEGNPLTRFLGKSLNPRPQALIAMTLRNREQFRIGPSPADVVSINHRRAAQAHAASVPVSGVCHYSSIGISTACAIRTRVSVPAVPTRGRTSGLTSRA